MEGILILTVVVAAGSFIGGLLSSGIVLAFVKHAQAVAKAEEAKLKADAVAVAKKL